MKGINSVKLVLLVSAVLLVFSVGFYFYQVQNLKSLTRDVGICFHQNLPEVGRINREINVKQTEIEEDEKRGVETHSYVEERANESNIRYDFLKTSKPREYPNKREGYIDCKIEIDCVAYRK